MQLPASARRTGALPMLLKALVACLVSLASPWVAGEAALLLSLRPSLSVAALASAIKSGAASLDASNPTLLSLTGAGRIDIAVSLGRV